MPVGGMLLQNELIDFCRQEAHTKFEALLKNGKAMEKILSSFQANIEAIQSAVDARNIDESALVVLRSILQDYTSLVERTRQRAIVESLQLTTMSERYHVVADAEGDTFSWIFDAKEEADGDSDGHESSKSGGASDSASEGASDKIPNHLPPPPDPDKALQSFARDTFIDWLEHGNGIFYISGKPGAGKSTFMKYICSNEDRLFEHLSSWAGTSKVIQARFFFWKPAKLQSTWMSFLREVLYQILSKAGDLVPDAFPRRWSALQDSPAASMTLEDREIRDAFDTVLRLAPQRGKKLIIFIDGLDEADGSHLDITRTLRRWSTEIPEGLKICVSSREWNVFIDAFQGFPNIKLHTVTRGDIIKLASTRLGSNPFWQDLIPAFEKSHYHTSPDCWYCTVDKYIPLDHRKRFIEYVASKAEGVFLWLSLILETVEEGLQNGDGLQDLMHKISESPTELEELFGHHLKSISKGDRQWAIKALMIARVQQVLSGPVLSLFQMSYLDDYCRNQHFAKELIAHPRQDIDIAKRIDLARRRVYGRCRGLLEVRSNPWTRRKDHKVFPDKVLVTHRAIHEFLELPETVSYFEANIGGRFDPFDAICQTFVAQAATNKLQDYILNNEWGNEPMWVTHAVLFDSSDDFLGTPNKLRELITNDELDDDPLWITQAIRFDFRDDLQAICVLAQRLDQMKSSRWFEFLETLNQIVCVKFNELRKPLRATSHPTRIIRFLSIRGTAHEYLKSLPKGAQKQLFNTREDIEEIVGQFLGPMNYEHRWPYESHVPRVMDTLDYCLSQGLDPDFRYSFFMGCTFFPGTFFHDCIQSYLQQYERRNPAPLLEVFLRHGASSDLKFKLIPPPKEGGDHNWYVTMLSKGKQMGVSLSVGHESPIARLARESNNLTITLPELLDIWVPKHASRFRRMIKQRTAILERDGGETPFDREINSDEEEPLYQPVSNHFLCVSCHRGGECIEDRPITHLLPIPDENTQRGMIAGVGEYMAFARC